MIRKVLLMLCSSALINAASYTSVSTPFLKTVVTPVVEKTFNTPTGYTKIIQSQPVYQSVLTTKESNYESPDGTQHTAYTKSLDTAYSSLKKYETKSTNNDVAASIIPSIYSTDVHSPIIYHQGAAYSISSPLVHTVNTPALTKSVSAVPVTYTTHSVPLTKTIVSPSLASYSTPGFGQSRFVTSGLSSYSSHTPVIESQPIKTTITYSQAPLVSHMSFSGLGASYAW